MMKIEKNNKKEVAKKVVKKVGKFINDNASAITICALCLLVIVGQVYAGDAGSGDASASTGAGAGADALWTTLANTIKTWVERLGGVVMFVGGIMFGLGWKNDDADGKTRGINTMIAGGIVIAVAALTSTFFK